MIYFFELQQDGWNVCDSVVRQRPEYDAGVGSTKNMEECGSLQRYYVMTFQTAFQLHLQDRSVQYASGLLVFTEAHNALFRNVGNILSVDMPWRPNGFDWSSAFLWKLAYL